MQAREARGKHCMCERSQLTRQSSTPSAGAQPFAALSGGSNAAPVRRVCSGGNASRLGGVPTYVVVSITLCPTARGDVAVYPSAVPIAALSVDRMKSTYRTARARQSISAYVGGTRGRSPMFPMGSCSTITAAKAGGVGAVAIQHKGRRKQARATADIAFTWLCSIAASVAFN